MRQGACRDRADGDAMAQMADGTRGFRRGRAVMVNDIALDGSDQKRKRGHDRQGGEERSSSAGDPHLQHSIYTISDGFGQSSVG